VAKQPGSWWPAEGETRLSKRHDKASLGGEQAASPYDEEPCSLDMVTMREPSLSHWAKAMDGVEILEFAAPMYPPG
jgi:hypothetical protein